VKDTHSKQIIAQYPDKVIIRTTALKKWATDVSGVKISLPRVEMHIKALEGR
jgi:hypothetical protein